MSPEKKQKKFKNNLMADFPAHNLPTHSQIISFCIP